MGLFKGKQQSKKHSPSDEVSEAVHEIFDEQYREELRRSGQEHFGNVINESAAHFKQDLAATITQVATDLKEYMTKQLDRTIAQVDAELNKKLNERLSEYDRVVKDAQNLAVQSLNSSAQAVHTQQEQLSHMLEKTVAEQEVVLRGVFEESKANMTTVRKEQDAVLRSLGDSAHASQEQSLELSQAMQKTIAEQESILAGVFHDTMARINATKDAQDAALQSLNSSAQAVHAQHEQLSQTLQKAVADQEAMLVEVFQDNMAQIIEHYLLGAMGDQFDMKAQLPLIIHQMEANKQAIVDDMKL